MVRKIPNRILKESITTSEDIAKLSQGAEILFYRLMVKADDYGAYFGNEQIVKSECFPLKADELKSSQVKKWLDELDAAGLIVRYIAADGRKYLKLAKWAAHQRIRNQKSKFPPLDDNCCQLTADDSNSQTSAVNCARNPIQSESNTNPNPNPNPNPTTGVSDDYTDDFELFWNVYPKKVGKKDAFNAFKKAKQPIQLLIHAVQEQMQTDQWQKENGRFIPNPSTWLNQGRWDDQVVKYQNPYLTGEMFNDRDRNTENPGNDIYYLQA